jgi:hypothetical protein
MGKVRWMIASDRAPAAIAVAAALAIAGPAASAGASAAPGLRARRPQAPAALRLSPELWATIDVCSPPHERYTIGIRGSMPGDAQPHDTMFMRFRLQFMDLTLQRWADLAHADSGFLPVGTSRMARQGGRSFVLFPPSSGAAYTLRGVVSFQWRRGSTVLATISRPTRSGHQSLAGADPPNYSSATCRIG